MKKRTSTLPITCVVAFASVGASCTAALPETANGTTSNTATSGSSSGATEESGGEESGGEESAYQVLGGAKVATAASEKRATPKSPWTSVSNAADATAAECPFIYDPSPCDAEACQIDQQSPECQEAFEVYCTEHPDDPACPNEGGECPYLHEPNPCSDSACMEPMSTACEDAHHAYCEAHPDDPICQGGGGGGCPYLHEPNPCTDSACLDTNSQECAESHQMYCEQHPDDPICEEHGGGGGSAESFEAPAGLWMKIYKIELSTDAANCSNPIVVGENEEPEYQNLLDNPVLFNGEPPPAGEYPCVIITMSDFIRFQGTEACLEVEEMDVKRDGEYGNVVGESIVTLYLSTLGESPEQESSPDSSWMAPGILLTEPHIAGPDVLHSTFFIEGEGVALFSDGSCGMERPLFGFETAYK